MAAEVHSVTSTTNEPDLFYSAASLQTIDEVKRRVGVALKEVAEAIAREAGRNRVLPEDVIEAVREVFPSHEGDGEEMSDAG